MKRLFYLIVAALMLAACTKNEVDPREKVTGAYDYTADGQLSFVVMQEKFDIPLKGDGTFTISKYGDKDRLKIEIFNDSVFAILSNNIIQLEDPIYTMEMQGMELEIEVANDKIQVIDSTLEWKTDLEATIKYQGMGLIGKGSVSMSADKAN